jgi:hypothetical protein
VHIFWRFDPFFLFLKKFISTKDDGNEREKRWWGELYSHSSAEKKKAAVTNFDETAAAISRGGPSVRPSLFPWFLNKIFPLRPVKYFFFRKGRNTQKKTFVRLFCVYSVQFSNTKKEEMKIQMEPAMEEFREGENTIRNCLNLLMAQICLVIFPNVLINGHFYFIFYLIWLCRESRDGLHLRRDVGRRRSRRHAGLLAGQPHRVQLRHGPTGSARPRRMEMGWMLVSFVQHFLFKFNLINPPKSCKFIK